MNKLLKNLFLSLVVTISTMVGFTVNAMEDKTVSLDGVPSYCRYKDTVIEPSTIGKLAHMYTLPSERAEVVRKWRDDNKELVRRLVDFSYPNSEMRTNVLANRELLKEQGLESQSGVSYTFALPIDKDLYFHVASQYYGLHNLRRFHGHDWNYGRTEDGQINKEEIDSLAKEPTFQTASDFIGYLQFLETAEKEAFNHFSAPATYLVPVDDNQPLDTYHDGNTFIIQDRLNVPTVRLCDDSKKVGEEIPHVSSTAFKELLTGIQAIGIWDSSKFLVDEENNVHIKSLRQPDNSNPRFFHNKNRNCGHDDYGSYASYSFNISNGFKGLYNFYKKHNDTETQSMIRDFAENNLDLPNKSEQKRLFKDLDVQE